MYVFIWSVHKANWVVRNRGAVPLGHLNLTISVLNCTFESVRICCFWHLKRFLYTHQCGANNLQVTQKKNQKTLLNRSIKTSSVWWVVVFHPTVWFFSVWQNSSLSKANQGWKRDEGGDSGGCWQRGSDRWTDREVVLYQHRLTWREGTERWKDEMGEGNEVKGKKSRLVFFPHQCTYRNTWTKKHTI